MSFSLSDVNDALFSEDIEEDENALAVDNLVLPTNLNWINSRKGYENYCQVLERIQRITVTAENRVNTETTESEIAKKLLNASERNLQVVLNFLKEVSTAFCVCYVNVEKIKCSKKKMIELERNFTSLNSNNVSLNRCWCSLLTSCDLDSTSSQNDVVLYHILQHFWSCLLLYQSHGLGDSSEAVNPSVNNNTECPTTSSISSVENIELQAITEHSGWVCKRVRDTFKDGPQTCKIQLSKTNNKCIEVQRQYVMDLIKRLGEDKLVQPGKFLFIPSTEIVQFFVYLHTAVENIVKVGLSDKDILKHCLQVLSESSELRELWCKVLCGDEDEIFMAARVLILQRIVSMFVKSKQQIIREQLQLKAQKQGSSFRQSLIKTKSAKKVKKQPTEKEVENYKCLEVFRQNSEDSICVAMFLTEVFANPAEAPNILNNLQGREISRILKSLGLPSFSGKSKKRQIDVLLKHNADGKDWIISFPDKLKEDHT